VKHIILGREGESKAAKYLKKIKFKIIEINHTNVLGEIDIIAKDKKELVFVEVKTRTSNAFGTPATAVTKQKQRKLTQVATLYLKSKNKLNSPARFDVIEVLGDEINHIKNAF
jgi:putative endonuclease